MWVKSGTRLELEITEKFAFLYSEFVERTSY